LPQQISVADAIAAVEGPLSLTECCSSPCECGIAPSCDLKGSWPSINHIVIEVLNKVSVADLSHTEALRDPVQFVSVDL
ncbi:MAG: Rrf2 family transcriptional regulator, partial [Pseudomonadales bacterium]